MDILSDEYLKIKFNATNIPEYKTICMFHDFFNQYNLTESFQSLCYYQDMGKNTFDMFCQLSSFPSLIF